MIDAIIPKPQSPASPSTPAAFSVGTKTDTAPNASGSPNPPPTPLSPRLRYDAVSGIVITEFLDTGGGVQTQTPSNAVVAYLRAGLGADGRVPEEKANKALPASAAE